MAKKREEERPAGSPAWMATFSDMMNLLLCFFVLLYSMSSVDEAKWEQVVASLQSTVSILPAGGSTIGEGDMISAGVRQLEFLDSYYNEMANSKAQDSIDDPQDGKNDVFEEFQEEALSESEQLAQEVQAAVEAANLAEVVDIDFNSQYVRLNLNGAILFDSGKSELVREALPTVDKIGRILEQYKDHIVEVEGHTDNVPISSSRYEDNNVLSMYRALAVADYFREHTDLDPAKIKSSGRGEYVPVADNTTAEGRAMNRRVEIKIYNSYSSGMMN